MNDPVEHATGAEKFELMQKAAGNDVSLTDARMEPPWGWILFISIFTANEGENIGQI
jgi:hypothetical protein